MNPKDKKKEAEEEAEDPKDSEAESTEAEEEISPEEESDLSPEELRAELLKAQKALKAANGESAARRKRLEEIEQAEAERKKAELSEIERAQAEAKEAKEERDRLKVEADNLKLEAAFGSKARELKISFVNETAREDAYKALDREMIGDDYEGIEEAIKKLLKERPFLFGKSDQSGPDLTDGSRKGKRTQASDLTSTLEKKRKSSHISPI